MLYKSHKVVGLATAAGLAATYNHPITFGGFIMVLLGSGLPDIDNPSSKLGRLVPIISKHLKHRGITHSVYALAACLYGITYTHNTLIIALSIGIVMHIIADLFSADGLDLFLINKPIRMPITYTVGGKFEWLLRMIAWILLIYYLTQLIPILSILTTL